MSQFHVIRNFSSVFEANTYLNHIKNEGYFAELLDQNFSTSIYPLPQSNFNIRLAIRKEDEGAIEKLILELEEELKQEPDFREATHEDIEFEKQLHETTHFPKFSTYIIVFVLLLIVCFILFGFFKKSYS